MAGRVELGGNGDQALSVSENLRSALLGSGVGIVAAVLHTSLSHAREFCVAL